MTLTVLADIGGTNTRVALAQGTQVDPSSIMRFSNTDYKARGQDIGNILRDYLAQHGVQVSGVCVAAAGLVQDGAANMTNLNWRFDRAFLCAATGAQKAAIINDMQAQGYALSAIAPEHLSTVLPGPQQAGAPKLVVGLGTGVNAAPVHGQIVAPSESGHITMPVRDAEELALLHFIEAALRAEGKAGHCSVEEVLSGRGLANLYSFAAHQRGQTAARDSGGVITALEAKDPAAQDAARLYTQILARSLADAALVHLPYGGIYLIGGMARAIAPYLSAYGFAEKFRELRRVDLLQKAFCIQVVEDDYAALIGCAAYFAAQ